MDQGVLTLPPHSPKLKEVAGDSSCGACLTVSVTGLSSGPSQTQNAHLIAVTCSTAHSARLLVEVLCVAAATSARALAVEFSRLPNERRRQNKKLRN